MLSHAAWDPCGAAGWEKGIFLFFILTHANGVTDSFKVVDNKKDVFLPQIHKSNSQKKRRRHGFVSSGVLGLMFDREKPNKTF